MTEYIEREAFKQKYLCCGYLPEMSEKEFDEFPAADAPTVDAVVVVRCKDCARCGFCGEATNLEVMGFYGYCSRGKRKEGI